MSLYAQGVVRVLTDPDTKFFESGSSVVKFLGGLNEGKDKDGNYINNSIEIEAWNKNGEVIINYAPKGSSLFVSGNIRQEEWDDKDTGAKRRKHVFKAGRVELLPRSGDSQGATAPLAGSPFGASPVTDEEIPF